MKNFHLLSHSQREEGKFITSHLIFDESQAQPSADCQVIVDRKRERENDDGEQEKRDIKLVLGGNFSNQVIYFPSIN